MFDFSIFDENPFEEKEKENSLLEEAFIAIPDDEEPFADEESAWLKNAYAPDQEA